MTWNIQKYSKHDFYENVFDINKIKEITSIFIFLWQTVTIAKPRNFNSVFTLCLPRKTKPDSQNGFFIMTFRWAIYDRWRYAYKEIYTHVRFVSHAAINVEWEDMKKTVFFPRRHYFERHHPYPSKFIQIWYDVYTSQNGMFERLMIMRTNVDCVQIYLSIFWLYFDSWTWLFAKLTKYKRFSTHQTKHFK